MILRRVFNADQLQMIQEFVAERGGGFLMSGMIDEEFIGTPVEDVLPVSLVEESFLPSHLRGGIRREPSNWRIIFRGLLTTASFHLCCVCQAMMEKMSRAGGNCRSCRGIRDRPNQARSNRADGAPVTAVSESGSTGAYNAALRQRPKRRADDCQHLAVADDDGSCRSVS